jgi:hypothetical protein
MNLLNLTNSSLTYIYCSTTLLNHRLIRFSGFVSELVSIYAIGFIISLYLILIIGIQTSDVTVLV